MLLWVAQDIDSVLLGFVLEPVHTENLYRLEMLLGHKWKKVGCGIGET